MKGSGDVQNRTLVFEYTNRQDASEACAQALNHDDVARAGITMVGGQVWLLGVEVHGPTFIEERRRRVRRLLGPDIEVKWEMTNAHVHRATARRVAR